MEDLRWIRRQTKKVVGTFLGIGLTCLPVAADSITLDVIGDTDFNTANWWSGAVATFGATQGHTVNRVLEGSNALLQIWPWNGASGGGNHVAVFYQAKTYNPSLTGAFDRVRFDVGIKVDDGAPTPPYAVANPYPAIRQDGKIFAAAGKALEERAVSPKRRSRSYTESELTEYSNGTFNAGSHPDFSVGGGPIEVGLINQFVINTSGQWIQVRFDDFEVHFDRTAIATFGDANFNIADWASTQTFSNGATNGFAVNQVPDIQGNALQIWHWNGAAGGGNEVLNMMANRTYTPSLEGGFDKLAFEMDVRVHAGAPTPPFATTSFVFVVRQGGFLYASLPVLNEVDTQFHAHKVIVDASSLDLYTNAGAFNSAVHPDFSTSGAPIEFGFVSIFNIGTANQFIQSRFDNFRVDVLRDVTPIGDTSFNLTAWSDQKYVSYSPTSTYWSAQVTYGPSLVRQLSIKNGSSAGGCSVLSQYNAVTYNPAVEGAIEGVDMSMGVRIDDGAPVPPHATASFRFVVIQGGKVYVQDDRMEEKRTGNFETHYRYLTAANFVEYLTDGSTVITSHPDFSSNGGVIRFGFEQTLNIGTINQSIDTQYDDFAVEVLGAHDAFPTYGQGCAGTQGFIPTLSGNGCPEPDGNVGIDLANAFGGSTGFLFVGTDSASIPFGWGCDLLVSPPFITVAVPIFGAGPGNGFISFSAGIPANTVTPLPISLQAFVSDPGVPSGFSTTNGVRFVID